MMMLQTIRPMLAFEIAAGSDKVLNTLMAADAAFQYLGGEGGGDVIAHIRSGTQMSGSVTTAGTNTLDITTTGLTADKTKLILANAGNIDGKGGAGGAGGANTGGDGSAGGAASGTALKTAFAVDVFNHGNIRQGGGGGGGGGGAQSLSGKECGNGGAGGAGGAGFSNGTSAVGGSAAGGDGGGAGNSGGAPGVNGLNGVAGAGGSCPAGTGGAGGSAASGFATEGTSSMNFVIAGTVSGNQD